MPRRRDIGAILADTKVVEAAMRRGVRAALVRHLQAGLPVAAWRDGRAVWVGPEELAKAIREMDAADRRGGGQRQARGPGKKARASGRAGKRPSRRRR
jgi:hypothetical protein